MNQFKYYEHYDKINLFCHDKHYVYYIIFLSNILRVVVMYFIAQVIMHRLKIKRIESRYYYH